MRALRFHGVRDLRIDDVPEPELAPGMLRTQVEWCGICGSDLHEYTGGPISIPLDAPHPRTGVQAPVTLGHEVAERVLEVGEGVEGFAVGDLVVPESIVPCDACDRCRAGEYNMCSTLTIHGYAWPTGGFAEREVVPAAICHRVPDGVTAEEASFAEPLAVALRAVERAEVVAGETVVVFGAGPIGLLIVAVLRAAGAEQIVSVEPFPARAASARRAGADVVLDPREVDVAEAVQKLTGGRGADAALDAAGADQSFADAQRCVRVHGRVVNVAAWERPTSFDPMTLIFKEITITGTLAYTAGDFPRALQLLADKKIDVSWMISRRVALDDVIEQGFDALLEPGNDLIKVIAAP